MIEWGEIYAKEEAQLAPSIAAPVEEAGMFTGSLTAIPQGVKHGWDVAASAMANATMPILSKVTSDSMTEWLDKQRKVANESMKATRTDPRTVGTVGQLLHGVSSVLTMGAMGGIAMGPVGAVGAIGGLSMFEKSTELMEQGVDLATAQKVGAVTGTVMGVGAALPPFLGGTLGKQIASGIGINVGLGVAERAGSAAILEDKYAGIAQHYNAMDGTAMAIDAVLGAAFPLGARMLRKPTVAQIDDALDANRVVAEQSRDPALQATLEGIDRKLAVDMEVTRQIMEEGRPLGDIEIPANVMDDTVPNRAVGEAAAAAAKAIDDLMVQESGRGVGAVEADIAAMARAFNPERVEPEVKAPDTSPLPKWEDPKLDGGRQATPESEVQTYSFVGKNGETYYLRQFGDEDMYSIRAYDSQGRVVGELEPAPRGYNFGDGVESQASWMGVKEEHRRQGINTAMNELASRTVPGYDKRSNLFTEEGLAWFDAAGKRTVDLQKVGDGKTADKTTAPPPDIEAEVSLDQFTKQAAQSIIDTDPNFKVVDENGKEMAARDLLEQAETRFKQEKQETALFKVAVACAIGVGE